MPQREEGICVFVHRCEKHASNLGFYDALLREDCKRAASIFLRDLIEEESMQQQQVLQIGELKCCWEAGKSLHSPLGVDLILKLYMFCH